jgi:acetate kinase
MLNKLYVRYFDIIKSGQTPAIEILTEIQAVGHRVVHEGGRFMTSFVVDNGVIKPIKENTRLAPLLILRM